MKKSYVRIAAAGALWGLLSLFFGVLSAAGLTSPQAVGVRTVCAAVVLWVWLLVRNPRALRLKRLSHLWYFVGTGMVSLAFFNSCYFICIERSTIGLAALLLYTAPVFVMLFSAVLFGEHLTRRKLVALVLTVLGCGLATGALTGGLSVAPDALAFGLASGIGYALYTIFGKFALRDYDSQTITAYTMLFASLGILPLAQPVAAARIVFSSPSMAVMAISGGVLCTVLPYLLYTKGLKQVDAGRASIIACIEPVVAALVGMAWFGEPLVWGRVAGMALVLLAIALLNLPVSSTAAPKVVKKQKTVP